MRPDVARSFARDLRFLELLVWVITTLGIAKWLELEVGLKELKVILLSDNRIALLDFGSIGRLTPANWTLYRYSLAALAAWDYIRAADLMVMLSPTVAAADIKTLRRDIYDALSAWAIETEFLTSTYTGRSIGGMSDKVSKVMAAHNVPLAWGIMRVGRTLSTRDASLQALDPSIDFMALCRRYDRLCSRRMRTLRGAKATLRSAMVQLSTLADDTNLLLRSGIRGQALQFSGVLDTLTVARLTLLRRVQRGTLIFVIVLCEALILSYVLGRWPRMRDLLGLREASVAYIQRAIPALHPLHWLLIIGGLLYALRMLGVFRRSVARTQ